MKIGLFIPCYINLYYPQVGIATYKLLQKGGHTVEYPLEQTCCGQPLGNSGFSHETHKILNKFQGMFASCELIVAPSASCVLFVKEHPEWNNTVDIFELSEFLVDHPITINHETQPMRVGILQSCHGLRGMHLGPPSELIGQKSESTVEKILRKVKGIEIVDLDRKDECCGFGGTFSIKEPELSVKMGRDRIADCTKNQIDIITGTDMSCLMHLEGIIRANHQTLKVKHFSELLIDHE